MDEQRRRQRCLFQLDQARAVRRQEPRIPAYLYDRAPLWSILPFPRTLRFVLAGDASLLEIKKPKRMLQRHCHKRELDFLFCSYDVDAAPGDLAHFDLLERLEGVEDDADLVSWLPAVARFDLSKDSHRRFLENARILRERTFLGHVAQ